MSGIWFRGINPETKKVDNVCFEDLSDEEQEKYMQNHDKEWCIALIKHLADTICLLGNKFDIMND